MSGVPSPALPLFNIPKRSRSASPPPNGAARSPNPSPTPRSGRSSQSITSTYAVLTPSETAERLQSSITHGLSPAEAQARLRDYGLNELPHEEPEPLWLRFLKQFQETLILLLLGSAAISLIMGNWDDAISITVAVIIVTTVGFVQEYRSEKSLEALNQLVPHSAHIIRGAVGNGSRRDQTEGPAGAAELHQVNDTQAALQKAEKFSQDVSASQLVPGDLVIFHTGDRIPADIRIVHSADLSIDESNLTGENEPVNKSSNTLKSSSRPGGIHERPTTPSGTPFYSSPAAGTVGADVRLNEQTNIAFMGTLVRSGYGQGLVIGTGGQTEFGAISASLQEIESPRTPLQLSMDRLGKDLSYISFGVIGFIMLIGLWRGWAFLEMFTIGVSLAVAAIPEGLPIIVTVTLALGVLRMSKRGAIVRRLPSVETLGSVNVVCSDKTGTLTTNHMTVTKIWHFDTPSTNVPKSHDSLDSPTRTVLRIGNIANNARAVASHANGHVSASSVAVLSTMGDDSSSAKSRWAGQPTDVACLDLLDACGEDDVRQGIGSRKMETPFSSERKWMGVVIQGAEGTSDVAYIKGALEQVLKRCDTYLTAQGREVILDEPRRQEAIKAADAMAQDGLRVLGFASGPVRDSQRPNGSSLAGRNHSGNNTPLSATTPSPFSKTNHESTQNEDLYSGLVFAGIVGMNDPPRKGVDKSIRRLMAGGVKVIMITGDADTTAIAIAKKLGMPLHLNSSLGKAVLRGDELDRMSDEELSQAIATCTIFARTSPDHKMKIIRALQARGDVVAMTGDGVNDAPALKKADIGVSMGKLGTDVAKEAADMILTDDDFSTILSAIEEGKGIFYNIQNFLTFQLSTSAAALSLVLLSTFFGFKNPLNAMQILWINILMDGPPAQSLGVEPVDPTIMSRPPRPRHARVLTPPLLRRVLLQSTLITLGTLVTYIRGLSSDGAVSARDTTLTFTGFVLFDMFNALACRSEAKSVLRGEVTLWGKGGNRMFNWAVAGSLVGQAGVIYLPALQRVFQTEALGWRDLVWLAAVASTVFWADEARKFWKRRGGGRLGGYSANV
ncbi:MAG: High affinity Ca2+/Mn2+ P-type ATPase-like protein [Bathelium mastoideum]|nr:MAG: High affinity Ca2+/Mn2+ P-type ATPase-like protein [Bathelium mastoideum]